MTTHHITVNRIPQFLLSQGDLMGVCIVFQTDISAQVCSPKCNFKLILVLSLEGFSVSIKVLFTLRMQNF